MYIHGNVLYNIIGYNTILQNNIALCTTYTVYFKAHKHTIRALY